MEFSKKWMLGNALVSLVLIIACAAGAQLNADGYTYRVMAFQ